MLTFVRMTRAKTPFLPYEKALRKMFGKKYELDLIFATPSYMKKISTIYRNIPKSTNVLSFNIDSGHGQIVLEPDFIKKELLKYNRSYKKHLWALYIHGLLHLKGYSHGKKMEVLENKLCLGI
ncbi:rRNA maturation RNase YbeY [Candidatus Giovannonibacteria bacterium]|nr:rRNA maturation RNase YbeY [Candidatus Giovannonibacteria bacterium]